jgi:hypothetical protein
MSMIFCDYQAEAEAAAQMADTATSRVDRSDWLFLALAWQALVPHHGAPQENLLIRTRLLRTPPKISCASEIECFGGACQSMIRPRRAA